jgi:hypothetical protein
VPTTTVDVTPLSKRWVLGSASLVGALAAVAYGTVTYVGDAYTTPASQQFATSDGYIGWFIAVAIVFGALCGGVGWLVAYLLDYALRRRRGIVRASWASTAGVLLPAMAAYFGVLIHASSWPFALFALIVVVVWAGAFLFILRVNKGFGPNPE